MVFLSLFKYFSFRDETENIFVASNVIFLEKTAHRGAIHFADIDFDYKPRLNKRDH